MYLHTESRETTTLDGTWQAIPDPYRSFQDGWFDDRDVPLLEDPHAPADYDVDDGFPVEVPGCVGEQLPEFEYYEGMVWHTRRFDREDNGNRLFLRFGAVNYEAEVWLNGEHLLTHEGGYTPFSVEITDAVSREDNLLVVGVDNERREDGIPGMQTDWFNFGGISRSVDLLATPETFVRNVKVETSVDETVTASITAWIDGPEPGDVHATIPGLGAEVPLELDDSDGALTRLTGEITLDRDDVELWHPDGPRLYDVCVESESDAVEVRTGFRAVDVEGSDILVNGASIEIRGISMHEEAAGRGRALTPGDIDQRFEWVAELGCNFVRLAHYPHTAAMARRADEEGILLWEEVPAYWDIDFADEGVQALYRQQLRELIQRDWNRPSVALWSIANETDPEDQVRNRVLPEMVAHVRELDDTRLVTAACWFDETDDGLALLDPLVEHLDVVGINEYYGWYGGEADGVRSFVDDPTGPPVIVSETGAGAKWGNHGDEDDRWTEEFQAAYYRESLEAIESVEQIVGTTPWILFDFKSPRRMNPHQRGYNRKGLLDQHGRKKRAFSVLRDHYCDQ